MSSLVYLGDRGQFLRLVLLGQGNVPVADFRVGRAPSNLWARCGNKGKFPRPPSNRPYFGFLASNVVLTVVVVDGKAHGEWVGREALIAPCELLRSFG
jgi:hypothetical protein